MSKLSDALAAMDKAAPGPWQWIEYGDDLEGSYMADRDREDLYAGGYARREATEMVAIAAPDMAAWIKEALPWLEEMRLHVSLDPAHYDHELARLDALIARAKE